MKTKKKLLMSVCALVFTIALAASSTYAWFTMNDKVELGSVDMTVTTGTQGLYASLEYDSNYNSLISTDDIETKYGKTTFKDGFTAVSTEYDTAKTKDTGKVFYKYGTFDQTVGKNLGKYTPGDAIAANTLTGDVNSAGSFISYTLHFRSTVAMNIYLNGDKVSADANAKVISRVEAKDWDADTETAVDKKWKSTIPAWKDIAAEDYGKAVTKGNVLNARAADAMRVAFVKQKKSGTGDSIKFADADDAAIIWNPGSTEGFKTGNMALDYMKEYLKKAAVEPATYPKGIESADLLRTTAVEDSGKEIAVTALDETSGFYEASVKINIWIDGFDGDCMNDILKDNFILSMGFIGVEVPETPEA